MHLERGDVARLMGKVSWSYRASNQASVALLQKNLASIPLPHTSWPLKQRDILFPFYIRGLLIKLGQMSASDPLFRGHDLPFCLSCDINVSSEDESTWWWLKRLTLDPLLKAGEKSIEILLIINIYKYELDFYILWIICENVSLMCKTIRSFYAVVLGGFL